jgi:hypothetical protein
MKSIFLIHLPETTVFSDHDITDIGYLYCIRRCGILSCGALFL